MISKASESPTQLNAAQKPLKQKLAKLEKQLETAQTENSELQAWLASEDAYAPEQKDQLATAVRRNSELTAQIAELEEQWLAQHEELETIERELELS